MPPEAQLILKQWTTPVFADLSTLLSVVLYLRGWILLRRSSQRLITGRNLAAFLGGMFFLWVAIGSPLSAFDEASLSVHMIQHILLMLVVPPLVLLGAPALPFLHGLPQWFVRRALGPFLRWQPVQSLGSLLTHPLLCWILAAIALFAWHVPAAFQLALADDTWHDVEHICFLVTSILFWWPVVQPYPSEARWPRWSIPPYLFFGMLPGGALGAYLCFSERVLYPSYTETNVVFGVTAMQDQVFAGALMWVFGSFVCLIPAVLITVKLLSPAALNTTPRIPSVQSLR